MRFFAGGGASSLFHFQRSSFYDAGFDFGVLVHSP